MRFDIVLLQQLGIVFETGSFGSEAGNGTAGVRGSEIPSHRGAGDSASFQDHLQNVLHCCFQLKKLFFGDSVGIETFCLSLVLKRELLEYYSSNPNVV